ncbi:MAG: CpsD/CapB family tyrosine-protein kinase [Gammaproteobacteria bacterium]|nr:CpsD/CapB family tyrosine-protein kinase [Gammaproteobacteria bacterium]
MTRHSDKSLARVLFSRSASESSNEHLERSLEEPERAESFDDRPDPEFTPDAHEVGGGQEGERRENGASDESHTETGASVIEDDGLLAAYDEVKAGFLSRFSRTQLRSFLICGTAEGDGTSQTAANLAKSVVADSELRLLLIDADLKRPSLQHFFEMPGGGTLDNVLTGVRLEHAAATAVSKQVRTRRGASSTGDPFSIFQSKAFDRFVEDARHKYDYVVFDGPPVLTSPESLVLAGKVDAVILVVSAGITRKVTAQAAVSKIERAGGKVAGVILNRRRYYIPNWLYKRL